jgi:CBS domain-containing protein
VDREYHPLPLRELGTGAGFRRPTQLRVTRVPLESAALGVITATDILGERPMLAATARGLRRDELTVADIMTAADQVEVVNLEDVRASRVGHVVETLRRAGRQHALVVDGESKVRGIFSLSQTARQLGVALPAAGETALTFSQIEAALAK